MRQVVPLLLLFASGCQIPEETGFGCSDAGLCPDGQVCAAGICTEQAEMALQMDLATVQDLDGSTPDLAPQVFGPVPGCVGPGRLVGSAYACPGSFVVGGAAKLCASGYAPLSDGTKLSDSDCRALPGFYAGTVLLSRYSAGATHSGVCMALPGVGQVRQFVGCGKTRTTVVDLPSQCVGFRQAVDLSPDPSWDSTGNTLDTASNTASLDGVLCFK